MPEPSRQEFEDAKEVARALRRLAMRQRGRKIEMLRDLGLKAGQDVVLLELADLGQASQNELALAVEVDEPSVGRSIQRLERKKLVQRKVDKEDARRRVVELTAEGAKLIPALRRIYVDFASEAAGPAGGEFHARLMAMLAETTARLDG